MRFPIEGSSSRSRLLTARLTAALCTVLAIGCEDEAAPPVIPPLAELSLLAPGEATGSPCVQRGDDARQSIVAQVKVSHFTLQPPLACTVHECGTVRFTLTKAGQSDVHVDSAQRFTSISTLELPDGRYTITASLLDTLGNPYESRDEVEAKCAGCTRTFTLGNQCQPEEPSTPEPSTPSTELPDSGTMTPQIPVEIDAGAPLSDASVPLSDAGVLPDASATNDPDGSLLAPDDSDAGNQNSLDGATPGTDSGSVAPDAAPPDAG